MNKVEQAREFLKLVGMPRAQLADICCYVLLAMAGIKPDMTWETEVWIAKMPEHMIHLNGNKFLEPR